MDSSHIFPMLAFLDDVKLAYIVAHPVVLTLAGSVQEQSLRSAELHNKRSNQGIDQDPELRFSGLCNARALEEC